MADNYVAVIGTGPAGLMAADILSERGFNVHLYDRTSSPARKLLLAGLGGLNLTHSESLESFVRHYSASLPVIEQAIRTFSADHLVEWCEQLGIHTIIGSSQRIFPQDMKASPLVRAWLERLNKRNVRLFMKHDWQGWDEDGSLIFKTDAELKRIKPDAVVFALGGASWPRIGTDGGWKSLFEQEQIRVSPLKPANMGINIAWSSIFKDSHEGHPIKSVTFTYEGEIRRGEAIVTQYGLIGAPVYAFSSRIYNTLAEGRLAYLKIDGKPDLKEEEIAARLSKARSKDSMTSKLRKSLNLSPVIIGLMREKTGKTLPSDVNQLARLIKHIELPITGTQGLDKAISTSGGLCLEEVNEHFMLTRKPGIFIAGEMLDWDAPTGGYLLQACFSTGAAAGIGAAEWLTQKKTA